MTEATQPLLPVTPELLPCPKCESENVSFSGYGRGVYCIICKDCCIQTKFYQAKADVIADWNTRRISHSLPGYVGMREALDELPDLKPVQLCGLSWKQALKALGAVDCSLRRPHWCSPVVILKDGMPVIDDDGDIKPFDFMPGDKTARDWAMVPRVGDDGKDVPLVYRASLPTPSALSGDAGEGE